MEPFFTKAPGRTLVDACAHQSVLASAASFPCRLLRFISANGGTLQREPGVRPDRYFSIRFIYILQPFRGEQQHDFALPPVIGRGSVNELNRKEQKKAKR